MLRQKEMELTRKLRVEVESELSKLNVELRTMLV